jgi:hypothetical protein
MGWPLPVIVASREEDGPHCRHGRQWGGPLSDDAAAQLLDRLLRGADSRDTATKRVGTCSGHTAAHREMVRMLVEEVLAPIEDRSGWSYIAGKHRCTCEHRIAGRWFIGWNSQGATSCASARFGIEFDPEVTEAVRRQKDWQGPPFGCCYPNWSARPGEALTATSGHCGPFPAAYCSRRATKCCHHQSAGRSMPRRRSLMS